MKQWLKLGAVNLQKYLPPKQEAIDIASTVITQISHCRAAFENTCPLERNGFIPLPFKIMIHRAWISQGIAPLRRLSSDCFLY